MQPFCRCYRGYEGAACEVKTNRCYRQCSGGWHWRVRTASPRPCRLLSHTVHAVSELGCHRIATYSVYSASPGACRGAI